MADLTGYIDRHAAQAADVQMVGATKSLHAQAVQALIAATMKRRIVRGRWITCTLYRLGGALNPSSSLDAVRSWWAVGQDYL